MEEYRRFATANDYFSKKRKDQQFNLLLDTIDEQLKQKFYSDPRIQKKISALQKENVIQPFALAKQLLSDFLKEKD